MPKTKVVRHGKTTVLIEAHGEVMFKRGAVIHRWTLLFNQRLLKHTRDFAPYNKRPRWAHYGPSMKNTFDGEVVPNPAGMEVGLAVGSSSDHALYVDQGTGIYAGRAPYLARILPPWRRGEPSLYESTWRPSGGRTVREVWIRGQKGQHFFKRGIERTFQQMLMRHYQLPMDPKVSPAAVAAGQKLHGFTGGSIGGAAFRAELTEWRKWRDSRWRAGGNIGPGSKTRRRHSLYDQYWRRPWIRPTKPRERVSLEEKRRKSAERSKRYRDSQRRKGKSDKSKDSALRKSQARDRETFRAAMIKKYGAGNVDSFIKRSIIGGVAYWEVLIRDPKTRTWHPRRAKAKS